MNKVIESRKRTQTNADVNIIFSISNMVSHINMYAYSAQELESIESALESLERRVAKARKELNNAVLNRREYPDE